MRQPAAALHDHDSVAAYRQTLAAWPAVSLETQSVHGCLHLQLHGCQARPHQRSSSYLLAPVTEELENSLSVGRAGALRLWVDGLASRPSYPEAAHAQ